MKFIFQFFIFIFLFNFLAFPSKKEFQNFSNFILKSERELSVLGDSILKSNSFKIRGDANIKFIELLKKNLLKNESIIFSFSKVKNLSIIEPKSKEFKIYNWALPTNEKNYSYFGFIQIPYGEGSYVYELKDFTYKISNINYRSLSPDVWFGALYYKVVEYNLTDKNKFFVLLGWSSEHTRFNMKVIETLDVNDPKNPIFGIQNIIILNNQKPQVRMVFKYSKDHSMLLRYEEKMKKIVFDHLSPGDGIYDADYSKYGPDFSYDALTFKDFKLVLEENILISN